ncbi:MAG: JmjC domain-containing protein [Bryobacteraceae bacterium]
MPALNGEAYNITGRELDDLLAPMPAAAFLSEYWGRKPLLIRGEPGKLHKLFQGSFDRNDLYQSLATSHEKLDLQAIGPGSQTVDPPPHAKANIHPEQAEEMFAAGATISAENIKHQRVAAFAAALKTQLGHASDVSVFATLSPGTKGFPAHVDRTDAFFIQCEGVKRYLISEEPVISYPRGTISFDQQGQADLFQYDVEAWEDCPSVDMSALEEVRLEPGDLLYSPAGTVHQTEAMGGYTLNLNLLLYHTSFVDLLCSVLRSRLEQKPAWRHLPQVTRPQNLAGELPEEVKGFFAARLREASEVIQALTADAAELNREWHKLVAAPGEATLCGLSTAHGEPGKHRMAKPRDVVQLSQTLPITCASSVGADGEPEFYVYCGTSEISVSGEWVPFLRTMLRRKRFRAQSATTWGEDGKRYPWAEVKEYLDVLIEQGILEYAESA